MSELVRMGNGLRRVNDKSALPKRHELDHYDTPQDVADALVRAIPAGVFGINPSALDIGAGSGVWGRALRKLYPRVGVDGVDIRALPCPPEYRTWYTADVLSRHIDGKYDVVMGNPPFNIAEKCVERAMQLATGYVVFLLPLSFLTSEGRNEGLFQLYPVWKFYALPRIPYTGNGNPRDDALFLWKVGNESHCAGWLNFKTSRSTTQS